MAACYWPLNVHLLAWVALVPWLLMLPQVSSDRAWLIGAAVGLVYYGLGVAWYFALQGPLAAFAILVLVLWLGLSFRVTKLLMERFSTAAMLWAIPLAFVGQEVLRSEGLPRCRFAYLAYGYSQSSNLWVAQIASIGGVYFVSFLLVAFNAALAHALIHRRRRDWLPAVAVAVVVVVLGLVSQPSDKTATEKVSVACVQAETFNHHDYLQLTTQALEHSSRPKFVILPEHTILDYADENHHLVKKLAGLARQHGAYVCIGTHTRASEGAECDYDNVALLVGPSGGIIGRQAKAVPLPFFTDGNPAQSQQVIDTAVGPVGVYICYDGNFTDITRRLVRLGAELLLVPIMNPEDWPVQQRWQQADIAPFRSIESRRWAVRAASSGVSQIVGPDGRSRWQRTRDEGPGVLYGTVHFNNKRTFFSKGGYLFATVVGVAYLGAVVWLTIVDWRRRFAKRR